jgi:glucose-1-phosphate cytidylyltransferase
VTTPVIILAGGRGTRISEESVVRPKPMVEIGGRPLLWHIMSMYSAHGFDDFLVACGYKGTIIKEYFHGLASHASDFFVDLSDGQMTVVNRQPLKWRVGVVDTGLDTMTGGRVRRLKPYVQDRTFMVTYGDGVSDVDILDLVAFHRKHGRMATVTAVRPPARFGGLRLDGDAVSEFTEKSQTGEGWINGGFFVFEPGVMDYLSGDETILEREPLERLAHDGQLMAYRHTGFWQPMDTLREKLLLEELCTTGRAPWMREPRISGADVPSLSPARRDFSVAR